MPFGHSFPSLAYLFPLRFRHDRLSASVRRVEPSRQVVRVVRIHAVTREGEQDTETKNTAHLFRHAVGTHNDIKQSRVTRCCLSSCQPPRYTLGQTMVPRRCLEHTETHHRGQHSMLEGPSDSDRTISARYQQQWWTRCEQTRGTQIEAVFARGGGERKEKSERVRG